MEDSKPLQSSRWEIVLVPKELVVLNDTTNHVEKRFAFELSSQRMYPGSS